jgi:hypothetical protein
MPTKMTTQPMTATQAHALADKLAAEERDLADRKRAARKAAELATYKDLLGAPLAALDEARIAAQQVWEQTSVDHDASFDQILEAWCGWRAASAARFAHVAQVSGQLDQLQPLRHETSGQPINHRSDINDYLAAEEFGPMLEQIVTARAAAASMRSRTAVLRAATDAGKQAEDAIG